MSGTLSAKRCVKLAPCSAAEARQVGGQGPWPRRPLGRRLDEHRGETPHISSVSASLQPLIGLVSAGETQCRHYPVFKSGSERSRCRLFEGLLNMALGGSLCQRRASEGAKGELWSGSRRRAGAMAAECT
jgi:hypothetical protein